MKRGLLPDTDGPVHPKSHRRSNPLRFHQAVLSPVAAGQAASSAASPWEEQSSSGSSHWLVKAVH
jgi:hypothetical protein